MKKSLIALLIFITYCCTQLNAHSAVILQYHHVSDTTPKSTSISPTQFEAHLQYLAEQHFNVVALSTIIEAIKNKHPLPNKTVAITFDDAYIDNLTHAKPLLDKYNYPFTIFVNPAIINRNSSRYLSWSQLKTLSDSGVIIANHGYEHNSLARISNNTELSDWLNLQGQKIIKAEEIIAEKTGKSWRYFAYPYGEYTPEIQQWINDNNFIAFGQQSGAVGHNTNLTSIPRFPASQPYDQLSGLRDKLNALPLHVVLNQQAQKTLFTHGKLKSITFTVLNNDFNQHQLNCYVSGIGRQKPTWLDNQTFTLNFSKDLPVGRVRANCTAPSIENPGRYYWYSKPWMILKPNGEWYPL